MEFLIWSRDHQAWWGPERSGYTNDLERAGRYESGEAMDVTDWAYPRCNSHLNHDEISDFPVPADLDRDSIMEAKNVYEKLIMKSYKEKKG